tara:strand:- start:2079 stop:2813 length:735 start_codon:yes stop_codon:yes gene_type:complete
MVNKLVLQSVINKYYLGEVESVKWKVQDKILTIDFMSINKEVIGNITHTGIDIEDSNLAIFDTKKLLNLINITSGDLLISLEKRKLVYTKLYLADSDFNLTYALSDPLLIAKPGTVEEPTWDAILPLEKEQIDNLIKAKSALTGIGNMTLSPDEDLDGGDICVVTFGDEQGHNNKIVYNLTGEIRQADVSIPFNSDMFKNILNVNKDLEEGKLCLSYQGILKLEFKSENTISTYYMVRQEESSF